MGQSPPSNAYNADARGLPFYQGNADFGTRHPKTRIWCDAPTKIAHAGDILLSVRAPIGALNIATETCCIGRGLAGLTANPEKIDPLYLYYVLQSKTHVLSALGTGSTFKAVSKTIVSEFPIPIYPLEKQKHIASVLDTIERAIDNIHQQLNRLDELVKSQFVELFGDLRTNSKKWMTRPLGELCSIYRGGSPRPITQFLGGDVPWIKIRDATKGDSIYLHGTSEHIKREGVSKSRMVKNGSLIFANCGVSLGFARITTFDGCIHDGWLSLEDVAPSLDKVFLLLSLNQMTEDFRMRAPTGTQPNLNTAIMKAHQQILPPLLLQQQYVSFIQQIDKSKLVLRQLLEKQQTLKAALMQEYFAVH